MSAALPIAVATTYSAPAGKSCARTPLANNKRSSIQSGCLVFIRLLLWLALAAALSVSAQSPANAPPGAAPPVTPALVLLLPAQSTPFARAADAVREGFFAAHATTGARYAIQVVEIDETPPQLYGAIESAYARGARMVVGPLTRNAVDTLATGPAMPLPVLALNVPSTAVPLPPLMLAFGLPVEEEARTAVQFVVQQEALGLTVTSARRYAVVTGQGVLAQRAGRAFADELRAQGEQFGTFDFALSSKEAMEVAKSVAERQWNAVFLALSAAEAATLRPWLGRGQRLIGTSRVNLVDPSAASIVADLEQLHFVDMPWLIEPDSPVVSAFPRPSTPYSAELERLYALGIDAYRIAVEWLEGRRHFELDGVTGWLRINPLRGARVERLPTMAVFKSGTPVRTDVVR